MKFRVKLHDLHWKSGRTVYRVAKDLGISRATVHRYVDNPIVEVDRVELCVVQMASYFGVHWKDVVEVIEQEEDTALPVVA